MLHISYLDFFVLDLLQKIRFVVQLADVAV